MDPLVRIVLADDHPLSLAGLEEALNARGGVKVVGRATNGIDALSMIKRLSPDCAVLDLSMPGATGLEVILEARRWSVPSRFVVVTGTGTPQVLQELKNAEVSGVFLKSTPVDEICAGILKVAAGGTAVSPAVRKILEAVEQANNLTTRELQVLQAIARGLTNRAASQALGISIKTIDTHRTNLMRKLGVRSTASLLVRAMRDGLIDVSDI
ncbi:MAG: response regulator transcription factor [Rhodobacteraceae bacterium]|nr:response regulator transcription factor [Paracoccaceae bacterium]